MDFHKTIRKYRKGKTENNLIDQGYFLANSANDISFMSSTLFL